MSDPYNPATLKVLSGYFNTAGQQLREMVLHPTGRTNKAQEFRQASAAQLITQIDTITKRLKIQSIDWTGKAITDAYATGIANANAQVRKIDLPSDNPAAKFVNTKGLIDEGSVAIFARDTAADLVKAADSMGTKSKRILRQTAQLRLSENDINRILANGVITGQPEDAIRTLRKELERVFNGGLVEVPTKGGGVMTFEPAYYAKMVAVTKTREAVCQARHDRLQEMGLDLVRIVGRISDNFCTAWLGQVFSISGKSKKYPSLTSLPGGGPPFHPNCSKSSAPYIEDLATDTDAKVAAGDQDAQKLIGMTPAQAQKAYRDLQLRQQAEARYTKLG